jgi:hypothetical protein
VCWSFEWLDDVPFVNIACQIHLLTGHTNTLLVCTVMPALNTAIVNVCAWQFLRFWVDEMGGDCLMRSFMAFSS